MRRQDQRFKLAAACVEKASVQGDFDASACIASRLGYTSLFPEFRLPVCLVGRITVSKLKFLILQGL